MASKGTNSSSKTPSKTKLNSSQSSPRELRTPNKVPQSGVPRAVFTHVSTLHGLLADWQRLRVRGTTVCRAVLALRLHECEEGEYPGKLAALVDSLVEALSGLRGVVDSMQLVDRQLQAAAQLQPGEEPVAGTWSVGRISREVQRICLDYQREYALKKYVTESVAHSRDEAVSEALGSAWELEAHTDAARELYLFADLGVA